MFGSRRMEVIEARLRAEQTAAVVRLQDEGARLRQELAEARLEIRRLTDVIIDMKREGFQPLIATTLPEREEETPLPDAVRRAILARADEGTDLYHQLVEDAHRMLQVEQRNEHDVVGITLRGGAFHDEEERGWDEDE